MLLAWAELVLTQVLAKNLSASFAPRTGLREWVCGSVCRPAPPPNLCVTQGLQEQQEQVTYLPPKAVTD